MEASDFVVVFIIAVFVVVVVNFITVIILEPSQELKKKKFQPSKLKSVEVTGI